MYIQFPLNNFHLQYALQLIFNRVRCQQNLDIFYDEPRYRKYKLKRMRHSLEIPLAIYARGHVPIRFVRVLEQKYSFQIGSD